MVFSFHPFLPVFRSEVGCHFWWWDLEQLSPRPHTFPPNFKRKMLWHEKRRWDGEVFPTTWNKRATELPLFFVYETLGKLACLDGERVLGVKRDRASIVLKWVLRYRQRWKWPLESGVLHLPLLECFTVCEVVESDEKAAGGCCFWKDPPEELDWTEQRGRLCGSVRCVEFEVRRWWLQCAQD